MDPIQYDSSAIFEVLPSFWKEYKDRPFLETVYNAYLRVTDNDYADLFTTDDNKDLATLRPFRFQPLAYQKFDAWEVLEAKHDHRHVVLPFTDTIDGNLYRFRFPNTALGNINLFYADSAFLPSFLYTLKETWWVVNGAVIRGTEMLMDRRKLERYFDPNQVLRASSNVTSDASTDFSFLRLIAFNPRAILVEDSLLDTTKYSFTSEYDIDTADFYVEFINVLKEVTVTYSDITLATIEVPPVLRTGERGLIELTNGTNIEINFLSQITVDVGSEKIAAVRRYVGFDLQNQIEIDEQGIRLANGTFLAGTTVSPRAGARAFPQELLNASARVSVPCDPASVDQINYLGTNINNFQVVSETTGVDDCGKPITLDQHIKFDKPLKAGSTFKILIAESVEHSHEYTQIPAPDFVDQRISLSKPSESQDSLMVFADGLLLYAREDYIQENSTSIKLLKAFPDNEVIEVYYETETATPHSHRTQRYVLDQAADVTEIPLQNPSIGEQTLVIKDSEMLTQGVDYSVGETVELNTAVQPATNYQIVYTTSGKRYRHLIPQIIEDDWNYSARLVSAESLSDGIELPQITIPADEFSLQEEGTDLYLYTDVRLGEGFWKNANFDERSLQNIWGSLLGIDGKSSDTFARIIQAIVGATRSPSSVNTIENFGSILLGSAYTTAAGFAAGINTSGSQSFLNIDTVDPTVADYALELNVCAPLRVGDGCIPRFSAVNSLVRVLDLKEGLPDWFGVALEELSDTFRAATRLDRTSIQKITSVPASYNPESKVLTDYSLDFKERGITVGSLVRVVLGQSGSTTQAPTIHLSRVERVLGPHRIVVSIPFEQADSDTGWSEGAWSEGTWGGVVGTTNFVAAYTIWGRVADTLDRGYLLDEYQEVDLESINRLIGAFNFAVELDWSAMKNPEAVEALGTLLEKVRPADTLYTVFTEAFSDLCSPPLNDVFDYGLSENDPTQENFADTYFVGDSFLGSDELLERASETETLYTGESLLFGTLVQATVDTEYENARTGEFYLVTENPTSITMSRTYSEERGLENLLVQVARTTETSQAFTAKSNLAGRGARGLKLESGAYIEINQSSSTGFAQLTSQPFEYLAGDSFTINYWVDLTDVSHAPTDTPTLFSWGNFRVDLVTQVGQYTPRARIFGPDLVSNVDILPDTSNMVTVTYGLVPGQNYYEAILYVNGVEVDRTTSTSPTTTLVNDFTAPAYLGRNQSGLVPAEMNATILLFDMRRGVLPAQQISELYNSGAGTFAPIGKDLANNPLAFPNAWVTYQFHSYWPEPVVPDYSGNAYNGVFMGTVVYQAGTLLTQQAQIGDCHVITHFETVDGLVTTVPKAVVFNNTIDKDDFSTFDANSVYSGSAALDNTLLTISENGTTFFLPNIAYCRGTTTLWERFLPDVVSVGSSIELDDSDLYTEFTV